MMAKRTLAGLVLLVIAGSTMGLPLAQRQTALRGQDAPACELCEGLVVSLSAYLSDPKTQAYVQELLVGAMCEGLPDAFHDTCVQELAAVYRQVVATVVAALDPHDVCTLAGVCVGTVAGVNSANGPFDCPMCRMVALTLLQRFKDPKVRSEMHTGFLQACNDLEPAKRPKCVTDVDALFQAVENIMDDLDPDMACEVAQFCPRPALGAGTGAARLAVPAAVPAMRALFHSLVEQRPARVGDKESCDNCKVVVLQAVAIIQNPKTQADIIEYAKESCSMFPDWQDSCEAYVTLYGPIAINMLVTYLQPQTVCSELGYCPPLSLA
uniref:Saposin B-type domain-containing protein n=2 Tax=Auxenochlorella protothecoides TaxID=3075 RepID=A0A1D1ZRM2_AUXPR